MVEVAFAEQSGLAHKQFSHFEFTSFVMAPVEEKPSEYCVLTCIVKLNALAASKVICIDRTSASMHLWDDASSCVYVHPDMAVL